MIRGRRGRIVVGAVALALAAGPGARAREAAPDRLPYSSAIVVRWGRPAGPDAFLQDLERALADEFTERCFARAVPGGPGAGTETADLVIAVVLSNFEDATEFDDTLAKSLDPDDPEQGMRMTARLAVDVAATLTARASGAVVVRRDLHATAARRPLVPGQDVQALARDEAIDTIVRDLRKAMCGSKTDRKVERALEKPPAAPSH